MVQDLKIFFKISIVYFVIISAIAGYGLGLTAESSFGFWHFFIFIAGTAFLSAGSLSLNQIQEFEKDKKMARTQDRPLVTGSFTFEKAFAISSGCLIFGFILLFTTSSLSALIGLIVVLSYNGFYTLIWKKKWTFGAVPGAIPGALPPVMGYAAVRETIFTPDCIYLFLIMFLWQMPHFWALAIKYKDDYSKGNFPVLPSMLGAERTKYHISLYIFPYILLSIFSPFFVPYSYAYFFIVLPFAAVSLWHFFKFFRSDDEKAWLPFFLVVNFSMLAFLYAPIADKWFPLIFKV